MDIRYVEGDVLAATTDVIAHQVNCFGVMGAGVASQIRQKYPDVYYRYNALCQNIADKHTLLGNLHTSRIINKEGMAQHIANLFGQYDYGQFEGNPRSDGRQTNYNALYDALVELKMFMREFDLNSVAFPDMIGCGLAGGNRRIVSALIEETMNDFKVEIWKFII
jgi:O-acetyl-ADP-ribose deacetylase (regulator of RNase III)